MGLTIVPPPGTTDSMSPQHRRAHRAFLIGNYLLLGSASATAFLTLSLRLVPSVYGFLLIILHALVVAASVAGCAVIGAPSGPPSGRYYTFHMVLTVILSIFEGVVAVLVFSRTDDFLAGTLKSYVREEDGVVIMRMIGGLGVTIFCLEWVVMGLAFVLRYYAYVDKEFGGNPLRRSAKVGEEGSNNWPWPFQV